MNRLKHLEKRAALRILLFLYEHGEKKWYEIRDGVKASANTINTALIELGKLKLITERREPPQIRYIRLTEAGRKIAEKISEINDILNEIDLEE